MGTCSFDHNPPCVIHHNLSYASPQMQIHNSQQQHCVKPAYQWYPPLLTHTGHTSTTMISHLISDPMQLIPYSVHLSAWIPTSLSPKDPWTLLPSNIHTWVINSPEYRQLANRQNPNSKVASKLILIGSSQVESCSPTREQCLSRTDTHTHNHPALFRPHMLKIQGSQPQMGYRPPIGHESQGTRHLYTISIETLGVHHNLFIFEEHITNSPQGDDFHICQPEISSKSITHSLLVNHWFFITESCQSKASEIHARIALSILCSIQYHAFTLATNRLHPPNTHTLVGGPSCNMQPQSKFQILHN